MQLPYCHPEYRFIFFYDIVQSTSQGLRARVNGNEAHSVDDKFAFETHWRETMSAVGAQSLKGLGDGLMATLRDTDALTLLQAVIHGWRKWQVCEPGRAFAVRFGLHFGSVYVDPNGDVRSSDVDLTKRIESAANSNQILLSEAFTGQLSSYSLPNGSLPDGYELHDLGKIPVKDFAPVRLYAVSAPGLESSIAPPAPPPFSSLPAPLDTFIGRNRERKEVRKLLRYPLLRCVTIIGSPGCGKTRLAQEVRRDAQADFPDGTTFVEMENATDAGDILTRIAAAFGLSLPANADVLYHLKTTQIGRRLLILDNFENVLPFAGQTVTPLLEAHSELRILVTSRDALNCRGEQHFDLAPLTVPKPGAAHRAIAACDSVKLFVARARAAQTHFRLTSDNAPQVAELCREVDGLPLAVEILAAQVRYRASLSTLCRDIRTELLEIESVFPDLPPRQRSLRATIDASFKRLDAPDKTLFAQLSLFETAFREQDVYDVCTGDNLETGLMRLQDKSLLCRDGSDEEDTYRLLTPLRAYARDVLGEPQAPLRQRFIGAFVRRAESLRAKYKEPPGEPEALRDMQAHLENFRSAWAMAQADDDTESLACLGLAVTSFAPLLPHALQLDTWIDDTMRALFRLYEDGANAARREEIVNYLGCLYNVQARVARSREAHTEAVTYQQEALRWFERIGNPYTIADAHSTLAHFAYLAGEYELAEKHAHTGIEWGRRAGRKESEAVGLCVLATLLTTTNIEEAKQRAEQSLQLFHELKERLGMSHAYMALAVIAEKQNDLPKAHACYRDATRCCAEIGLDVYMARLLEIIAKFYARTGRCDLADELLLAAAEAQRALGLRETARFALPPKLQQTPSAKPLSLTVAVEHALSAPVMLT